jgi:hypothetical protein
LDYQIENIQILLDAIHLYWLVDASVQHNSVEVDNSSDSDYLLIHLFDRMSWDNLDRVLVADEDSAAGSDAAVFSLSTSCCY